MKSIGDLFYTVEVARISRGVPGFECETGQNLDNVFHTIAHFIFGHAYTFAPDGYTFLYGGGLLSGCAGSLHTFAESLPLYSKLDSVFIAFFGIGGFFCPVPIG
ncbi:MAG TPA: hypothetical protein ENH82_10845 [bacterium]|nr:hypothetical protein [bacterium]